MSEPDLTPQTPGVTPGTDTDKLAALAAGNVGDLAEALAELDTTELTQLLALEQAGKNRTTAVQAIEREIAAREQPPMPEPEIERTPIGDAESYARMRWQDIDATKLRAPVLTLDGWLHPAPSAVPVE